MDFTIIIPHYKTGKMTAYAVSQLLKYQGNHNIDIIIVDNHPHDDSMKYLSPFDGYFRYVAYPPDRLQSHGIAFDYVLGLDLVKTDWFITIESDSFPTSENWLDYYEAAINEGYDAAGSLLKLSGGVYFHPCGMLYNKKEWNACKVYVDSIPYKYVNNLAMFEDFPCHCMIHNDTWGHFLLSTNEYVNLNPSIKTSENILHQKKYYEPVAKSVFHNGMGVLQESLRTYGSRTIHTDPPFIILDDKSPKIIRRMGYEPGQFFSYWMLAEKKRILAIPTMTQWMKGRVGQQQEFTQTVNGLKHLWGVSSYFKANIEGMEDVVRFKNEQPEVLYHSLPEIEKVPD